jgi:hypothetical protein
MSARQIAAGSGILPLFPSAAVPAAGTTTPTTIIVSGQIKSLTVGGVFTYGSAGTSVDCYVQTSLDQGATWFDIMDMQFLLASAKKAGVVNWIATQVPAVVTDGTLAANTILSGILGDRIRLKLTVVGAYAGTTLALSAWAKG